MLIECDKSENCSMCNGEACALCGAGCWSHTGTNCTHDVLERHTIGGNQAQADEVSRSILSAFGLEN